MSMKPKTAVKRFASVAQVRDQLSAYLAHARRTRQPVIVTLHGKPYALIQPISDEDLDALAWDRLGRMRLGEAWESEDDALYDYL